MNSPLFPVAIYPSQLDAFKTKADLLATSISETLSIKKLSAFKRNDYLSIALGYQGYPDLIESTKFRQSSDKNRHLFLFLPQYIQESIAKTFSEKIEAISRSDIMSACKQLAADEVKGILPGASINDIKNISNETAQAILSNANPDLKLLLKEIGTGNINQYGHIFQTEVAEIDMTDVLSKKPITIVDTSELDNETLRKQLTVMFGGGIWQRLLVKLPYWRLRNENT